MMTKDFLRQVLREDKKLLKKAAVTPVSVPKYDELSVKAMWTQLRRDNSFNIYFPDSFPKDKGPERKYFFDVLNSVHPVYLKQVMDHAKEQRFSAGGEAQKDKSIEATANMLQELQALPFISSKCLIMILIIFHREARPNCAPPEDLRQEDPHQDQAQKDRHRRHAGRVRGAPKDVGSYRGSQIGRRGGEHQERRSTEAGSHAITGSRPSRDPTR